MNQGEIIGAVPLHDRGITFEVGKSTIKPESMGRNNPIADNSTDEGRAENRRVEFVKQ